MKARVGGFTIVEVLVAVVVLAVGVLALVSSSGMVSRMIGRGKHTTTAVLVATERLERLRQLANSAAPRCSAGGFASGGPLTQSDVTVSWVVPPNGTARTVSTTVSYRTTEGTATHTLTTVIACPS